MGVMELEYNAVQLQRIIERFERMAAAAGDSQPVMLSIAEYMMEAVGKNFMAQGRRGGGSWKQLTMEWMLRKQLNHLDPRIGFATRRLFESLTVPGHADQEIETGPNFATLRTKVPYAGTQQEHRPFAKFTAGDRLEMRKRVSDYLMAAWRSV